MSDRTFVRIAIGSDLVACIVAAYISGHGAITVDGGQIPVWRNRLAGVAPTAYLEMFGDRETMVATVMLVSDHARPTETTHRLAGGSTENGDTT